MNRKSCYPFLCIALLLTALILMAFMQPYSAYAQNAPSPTPTYDPLVEPFVPENPTEYELGRNWYWHHCMPCHGDKGQGLTDEWRATWVPDHQDCWGRGCHAGERFDDSFAIPTIVPPVVNSTKLARFSSLQTLYEYLKETHPPQYPGHLEDEQYHAIALFVFSMNDRSADEATPVPTITPIPTNTPVPEMIPIETPSRYPGVIAYVSLGVVLVLLVIWIIWRRR